MKKSNTNAVLVGKFLAADSFYFVTSRVARNLDPINVMVAMLGSTEKLGYLSPIKNLQTCRL